MTYIFVHSLIENTKHDRQWPSPQLKYYALIFSNSINKSHWETDDCIVSWIAEAVTCIYWFIVKFKQTMFSFVFFCNYCSLMIAAWIY